MPKTLTSLPKVLLVVVWMTWASGCSSEKLPTVVPSENVSFTPPRRPPTAEEREGWDRLRTEGGERLLTNGTLSIRGATGETTSPASSIEARSDEPFEIEGRVELALELKSGPPMATIEIGQERGGRLIVSQSRAAPLERQVGQTLVFAREFSVDTSGSYIVQLSYCKHVVATSKLNVTASDSDTAGTSNP